MPEKEIQFGGTIETREQKEKREIGAIEQSALNFQDKESLLLVYLKEKPACWISAENRFYKTEKESGKKEKLEQLDRQEEAIESMLKKFNIPYYSFRHEADEEKTILISRDFFVGQDRERLYRLKEAWRSGAYREIGIALGYPESAVEGFVKNKMFDKNGGLERLSKREKTRLKKEGIFKFLTFLLSEENWREELELVRRYQKIIKEKSPQIYNEIIKEARDPLTFQGKLRTSFEKILNRIEYYKRSRLHRE